MPAKKRCQLQAETPCNSAVLRIVGQCPHCRAQFCGAVSLSVVACACAGQLMSLPCSTVCQNTTTATIWRTAGSRLLTGTKQSWRASGPSPRRWQQRNPRPPLLLHPPCVDIFHHFAGRPRAIHTTTIMGPVHGHISSGTHSCIYRCLIIILSALFIYIRFFSSLD